MFVIYHKYYLGLSLPNFLTIPVFTLQGHTASLAISALGTVPGTQQVCRKAMTRNKPAPMYRNAHTPPVCPSAQAGSYAVFDLSLHGPKGSTLFLKKVSDHVLNHNFVQIFSSSCCGTLMGTARIYPVRP